MVAAIASYKVLFSNNHADRINAANEITTPPRNLKWAGGVSLLLRRTGKAAQVTA